MAKRIRTFIAVGIEAPIRRKLVGVQRRLERAAENVKWVEEENIHLTLKFLGQVDERALYDVCRAVQEVAGEHEPFEMTVEGLGAFPHQRRPRVLWAGVSGGTEPLIELAEHIDLAMEQLGWGREPRRFTPHITIGRFRRVGVDIEAALADYQQWQAGTQYVTQVEVMSSELSSHGPRYMVLSRAELGK
jgi:2'-5' RNA ligase